MEKRRGRVRDQQKGKWGVARWGRWADRVMLEKSTWVSRREK